MRRTHGNGFPGYVNKGDPKLLKKKKRWVGTGTRFPIKRGRIVLAREATNYPCEESSRDEKQKGRYQVSSKTRREEIYWRVNESNRRGGKKRGEGVLIPAYWIAAKLHT